MQYICTVKLPEHTSGLLKKRLAGILFIFTTFYTPIYAQQRESDARFWTQVDVSTAIAHNWEFQAEYNLRWKENYTQLQSYFLESSLEYRINKHWRTQLSHRWGYSQENIDLDYPFHRVGIDLKYRQKKDNGFRFSSRLRAEREYDGLSQKENGWAPENTFRALAQLRWKASAKINLDVSEEFFYVYSYKKNQPESLRHTLSASFEMSRYFTPELFFIIQQPLQDKSPVTYFISGLSMHFSL